MFLPFQCPAICVRCINWTAFLCHGLWVRTIWFNLSKRRRRVLFFDNVFLSLPAKMSLKLLMQPDHCNNWSISIDPAYDLFWNWRMISARKRLLDKVEAIYNWCVERGSIVFSSSTLRFCFGRSSNSTSTWQFMMYFLHLVSKRTFDKRECQCMKISNSFFTMNDHCKELKLGMTVRCYYAN